jgi:hypothetical protein
MKQMEVFLYQKEVFLYPMKKASVNLMTRIEEMILMKRVEEMILWLVMTHQEIKNILDQTLKIQK